MPNEIELLQLQVIDHFFEDFLKERTFAHKSHSIHT